MIPYDYGNPLQFQNAILSIKYNFLNKYNKFFYKEDPFIIIYIYNEHYSWRYQPIYDAFNNTHKSAHT